MDALIKEYSDALQESLAASKAEEDAKVARNKAHKRLMLAKSALNDFELSIKQFRCV